MNWEKERDALLARTMEFVQSVAGMKENVRPEVRSDSARRYEMATTTPLRIAEPPADSPPVGIQLSRPRISSDFQREIQQRVASFRAHQERFSRERAEYFNATLARLRAAIEEAGPPRIGK
jgi:hypothetical protein